MIQERMIVKLKDYDRAWILIYVSQEYINNSSFLGGRFQGLYAFGGLWYGDPENNEDFLDKFRYGKCLKIKEKDIEKIIISDILQEDFLRLKNLLSILKK